MQYTSTRDDTVSADASAAILTGLAPDGGLFVPTSFPALDVTECYGLSYSETAQKVLQLFLSDYDSAFLQEAVTQTYSDANFDGKAGFVKKISDDRFALELWHGPTCAFKDYALQLMPKLLCEAKKLQKDTGMTKILVATSGDTGKAALAGYANLSGIKIAVFYPNDGTSTMQRLQMATQEGDNVAVYAVNGNFDDAQRGVKCAFADGTLAASLAQKGETLSSANSINWGRLVPQIVYYFYSYAQLVAQKEITSGSAVSFCVPTGNFGDILAGYYAKQMGLPIDKLICASNTNNVLTDFLETGIYNANRTFYKTTSPSMDILVSSNLERLLYHITKDSAQVAAWMQQLATDGQYVVSPDILQKIQETFDCGFANDEDVSNQIAKQMVQNHYLCDPHTAVAFLVAERTDIAAPCVVLSTASPYKFAGDVLFAMGEPVPEDAFAAMDALQAKTGLPIPKSLAALQQKKVRFTQTIQAQSIVQIAHDF
ncbi:MAG: threonine synthase [Ruthenibacterium sp.]